MSKSSRQGFQGFVVVTLGVMFLGIQPVTGQPGGEGVTDGLTTADDHDRAQQLAAIDAAREGVVKNLAQQWTEASGESIDVLEQTFGVQGAEQLLAIQNAKHFDQVRLIVLGQEPDDSDFLKALEATAVEPLTIGDTDKDFVYTPVNPCRIVDTRNAVGAFAPGATRSYNVYGGGGTMANQGGNPAGCTSPNGEPRAVHINVTIVPVGGGGNGFVQVWPFGGAVANASLVNFRTGDQNIANAGTVKTGFLLGPEISVKVNGAAAHVIIDVLGYYHEVKRITKYLSIPARGGFVPREDDGSFASCFPTTFAWSGVGDSTFYAMVNLPHGAVVTRLTYHFWRGGGAASETRADLYRQGVPATSNRTAMATVISTNADSGHTSRSDSSITNATIDNENFTYYVEVDLPQAGQLCTDGVVIRYTDIP